jgi:hypothetical protein
MTEKTITWVAPMGEADDRGTRWITVKFADGDTGYLGKKDLDAAIEVMGLLQEAVNQVLEFTLEDTGKTNSAGGSRFKIKAFGEYQPAPYVAGVQGGGNTGPDGSGRIQASPSRGRSPEPSSEQASIRASVALKAAVDANSPRYSFGLKGDVIVASGDINTILEYADAFNAWMLEKTSEPASSAYANGSGTVPPVVQAGAGPEDPSDSAGVSEPTGAESESGGGVAVDSLGKEHGDAPPPHEHIHDWQPHPMLRGKLECSCGEIRNKERANG